ncbi:Uncharacterised protein [Mycobacteroides abscessus subsp. massiliense]|nr:Uncharacterised protein [Mycobacteroides abscessus subsp. massiliense]SKH36018.1 Uncharacterised protein [Mycobacteroides abscessus subsp. massiliense]SKH41324.1 Uncharacterised protein [Mycobacteroides abscessus subsp. massiliense]SKH47669.1 Uncharacterised protein [Mycobacteroides abscessus subsp. massiliense]SKH98338.1 Uncharacterised protein [Mycobacteroides abscessus subsp. massiliense]
MAANAHDRQCGQHRNMGDTVSVADIRTAIKELSIRADLAEREGRDEDARELRERVRGYQDELARRP